MCNSKQDIGINMESITTELNDTELSALKSLKAEYQDKSDLFLKQRGFVEAVGKFTYFRLNNNDLELHIDGLDFKGGVKAQEGDSAFVKGMEAEYLEIRRLTMSIEKKATQLFESELMRKLALNEMEINSCGCDKSTQGAVSIHEYESLIEFLSMYSINGTVINSGDHLAFAPPKETLDKILYTSLALVKACRERLVIMDKSET